MQWLPCGKLRLQRFYKSGKESFCNCLFEVAELAKTIAWGLGQRVSRQTSSGLCGMGRRSSNRLLGPCSDTLLSVRSDMHKWHVPPH